MLFRGGDGSRKGIGWSVPVWLGGVGKDRATSASSMSTSIEPGVVNPRDGSLLEDVVESVIGKDC